MTADQTSMFAPRGGQDQIENGPVLQPQFDDDGLIPAIATAATDGEVLMFAWMNQEALAKTILTRQAHFWSRSRQKLWRKGEESGNTLDVREVRVDCDQDVIWLMCEVSGAGKACHTGARSCFYRRIKLDRAAADQPMQLEPVGPNKSSR